MHRRRNRRLSREWAGNVAKADRAGVAVPVVLVSEGRSRPSLAESKALTAPLAKTVHGVKSS